MLDITSSDKGLLIPRVNILDINTIAPITGGTTESLLVYNTNISTGKGFYFWNGSIWVNLNSDDWKVSGNTGTSPGTGVGQNYIGTTDFQSLVLATNATLIDDSYEALYIWDEQTGYDRSQADYKVISNGAIVNYTKLSNNYIQPSNS